MTVANGNKQPPSSSKTSLRPAYTTFASASRRTGWPKCALQGGHGP